ncbi:MAG: hypothetical protein U9N57_06410 [Pseudomonadota bacterium]|nr:hypothetical protein [Pseudomonadota bacterium]
MDAVFKIASKHSNLEILYVPHRGESLKKIEQINSFPNIRVEFLDYPIELYGLVNDTLPFKVTSFYSTALYTMNVIYGVKTEAIKLDGLSDEVEMVYDAYQKSRNITSVTEY